ncbi:MAG: helicase-related protein [Nakamurella sp.]
MTGNDAHARIVLTQLRVKVPDVRAIRAFGYCVSVEHSHYMAAVFNQAGIAATAVSGHTSSLDRANALQQLRDRKIDVLFAVDLFNEGLDLPEIDTVLFLRPTESATIFLQQLGRGVRHADGKSVLTVLGFVGHNREEFRFDLRYRALTGATRSGLAHQVEAGFPFLPSGCQIVLEQQTQNEVLANIRNQLTSKKSFLVSELRHRPTPLLRVYLQDTGAELTDVVRPDRLWTSLGRAAGLSLPDAGPLEDALVKRVRALAHVDDPDRAAAYRRLLGRRDWSYASLSAAEQALADMLIFSLWPDGGGSRASTRRWV